MQLTNEFYEAFLGEYVELTVTSEAEAIYFDEEQGPVQVRQPITISGYMVDADEHFVYIGDEAIGPIREMVTMEVVWRIRMIDPEKLLRETLEKFPVPTTDNEVN